MELNELIYAGAKLVSIKVGVPLKNTNRNSKPWWKIWLETETRNLQQQAKFLRKRKNTRICLDKKKNAVYIKQTLQFEEMIQKVLEKEGKLKRYWDKIK